MFTLSSVDIASCKNTGVFHPKSVTEPLESEAIETGPDSNDRLGINENTTVLGKYIGNPQPNRKVRTWEEPTSEGIAHGKMETLAIFERRNVVKAFLPRFVG